MTPYPIRRSGLLLLALLTPLASLRAEEVSPRDLLRDALYAEEVTRDPGKAAESYQKVLENFEAERPFAATALFRLAEVRRKQGNKEEAVKLYQRLLREFPGAEIEGKLARENLAAIGGVLPDAADPAGISDEESKELLRLQELVRTSPDLARNPNLLHRAAGAGQLRVMAFLIDSGIDPKAGSFLGSAVLSGNLKAVELLLAKGCDPGMPPDDQALKEAVMRGFHSIAELLVKSGAKVNLRLEVSPSGYTPTTTSVLHLAAWRGDERMCRLLLEHGADPNYMPDFCYPNGQPNQGQPERSEIPIGTTLHNAIAGDSAKSGELALLLMKAGAKPGLAAPASGLTPLHIAARKGNLVVLQALLEAGVPIDPKTTSPGSSGNVWGGHNAGTTPLLYAIESKSEKAVRLLLAKGANPNVVTERDSFASAISWSLSYAPELLKILIEGGAQPKSPNDLVTAVQKSTESTRLLIEAGADPNAYSPYYKTTPLQTAVEKRVAPETVQLLIDRGAKPDGDWLARSLGNTNDEIRTILFDRFVLPDLLSKPTVTLLFSKTEGFRRILATRGGDTSPAPLEALLLQAELPFVMAPRVIRPGSNSNLQTEVLPELITIYRQDAGGAIRKIPARLDGSAALPKLEWGDVVDMALDPASFDNGIPSNFNVSYHEVSSPEVFWNFRKNLAVPITAHIDGKAREITLRGDCLVYHPGEPVAPLLRAKWLAGVLWSRLAPDYLTIRRAGWPEIRIAKDNAEWEKFEFQPGDEVSAGYKMEDLALLESRYREGKVSLSVPGTGFGTSWWAVDSSTIEALDDIGFGKGHLAIDPRTIPTLVEMITHTYAGRPRRLTASLSEAAANKRWGEIAARQQGPSLTGQPSEAEGFGVLTIPQDPDLSKVRLLRKGADGKDTMQEIDLTKAIAATTDATTPEEARRGDVWLQAGDMIEISLKPQSEGKAWTGFNDAEVRFFSKVLGGTFQFSDNSGNLSRKNLVWKPVKWLPSPSGPVPFPPDQGVASTFTHFQEEIGNSVPAQLTRDGGGEEREVTRGFFIRDGDRIRMERPAVRPPRPRPQPQPQVR